MSADVGKAARSAGQGLTVTGARATAWCLLIHTEASLSQGGQGWCRPLIIHAGAFVSLALSFRSFPVKIALKQLRGITASRVVQRNRDLLSLELDKVPEAINFQART